MEHTDEELVSAAREGDEDAFARLVARHLKSVYSFALRLTGEDDADEVTQEAFLKVWTHLTQYDPAQAQFKTWLMRIVRNTAYDHIRRTRAIAFSRLSDPTEKSPAFEAPDDSPLPDELAARAEDARTVAKVLDELPPLYREVIVLRYMNQLSFEEVSAVLGESANTVRSRHRRGLARLKKALELTSKPSS